MIKLNVFWFAGLWILVSYISYKYGHFVGRVTVFKDLKKALDNNSGLKVDLKTGKAMLKNVEDKNDR